MPHQAPRPCTSIRASRSHTDASIVGLRGPLHELGCQRTGSRVELTPIPGHGLWSISESCGVLGWGEMVEAGLVALAIVEDLDELEEVAAGVGSGFEPDPEIGRAS